MSEKITVSSLGAPEFPVAAGALEHNSGHTPVDQVVDAIPQEQPPVVEEAPEAAYDPMEVSPKLQERFASTVEYIREYGDALDQTKGLRQRTIGFKTAATAVIVEPILLTGGAFHWGMVAAPLLISGPIMANAFFRIPKAQDRADKAMDGWLQHELGERFDIFTVPGDKEHAPALAMRYYGPRINTTPEETAAREPGTQPPLVDDGDATLLEHIQRMATLAKDNDIDHFMVGDNLADSIITEKDTIGLQTTNELLQMKKIKVGKKILANDRLVVQTPDFWLNVTERKQQEKTYQYVEGLLERVRDADPMHPLVELHDAYSPYLEDQINGPDTKDPMWIMRTEKMISAVQTDVQRNYSETTTHVPSKLDMVSGADPRRQKRYMHASLEGDNLTWTFNGQLMDSKDLADMLGFDRKILAAIVEDPNTEDEAVRAYLKAHPDESAAMLSSILIKRLKEEEAKIAVPYNLEVDELPPVDAIKRDPTSPTTDTLLSNGTWARADNYFGGGIMRKRNIVRGALGAAATVLAFSGSMAASNLLDDLNDRAERKAYEALTADGTRSITNDKLHAYAAAEDPSALTWGNWKQLISFSEKVFDKSATGGEGGSTDLSLGQAEKTNDLENGLQGEPSITTTWSLEAKGLSTEGYWATEVSDQANLSADGIQWIPRHEMATQSYILMPTELTDTTTPNIEVQRRLMQSDLVPGRGFFKIPVREGTRPVAATVDGKQTALAEMRDGTYGLTVPTGMDSIEDKNVAYWLVTDNNRDHAPHATRSVTAKIDGKDAHIDGEAVRRAWAEVIPDFMDMDPELQAISVEDYVEKNFKYRLKPFDRDFDRNATDLPGYTRRTIELGKALCTTANGISALATIGQPDIGINIAGGFLVAKPNSKELTNIGHAWQVDSYGNNKDDTPANDMLAEDKAFLNGKPGEKYISSSAPKPEEMPLGWYGAGLGALILTGAAALQHERLGRARRELQFRRAIKKHEQLLNADPALLHQASSVVEAMDWDPAQDVRAAIERGQHFVDNATPSSALFQTVPNDALVDKILDMAPAKGEKISPAMEAIQEAAARSENAAIKSRLTAISGLFKTARFIKRHPAETPKQAVLSATIK